MSRERDHMTYFPRSLRNLCLPVSAFLCLASLDPSPALAQGSPCNINQDASLNVVDVQLAVNMVLGLAPCTTNLVGPGICNSVLVQRVVNAVQGGPCVSDAVPGGYRVQLTWTPSVSPGIAGYNVYRGLTPGGPYTKVNTSLATTPGYSDNTVQQGVTYYYVVTAVNTGTAESSYSNMATVNIPSL